MQHSDKKRGTHSKKKKKERLQLACGKIDTTNEKPLKQSDETLQVTKRA